MSGFVSVKKNESLKQCPVCGLNADIQDFANTLGMVDGIGDVGCPNSLEHKYDRNSPCGTKIFHYSGKFGVSKREAVGMWNEYVTLYNEMKGENK